MLCCGGGSAREDDTAEGESQKFKVLEGRWDIDKEAIGEGGFGTVHLCRHKRTGKPRACKAMRLPSHLDREDFRHEVQILKAIKIHHNICHVVDSAEDARFGYLVMQSCCRSQADRELDGPAADACLLCASEPERGGQGLCGGGAVRAAGAAAWRAERLSDFGHTRGTVGYNSCTFRPRDDPVQCRRLAARSRPLRPTRRRRRLPLSRRRRPRCRDDARTLYFGTTPSKISRALGRVVGTRMLFASTSGSPE